MGEVDIYNQAISAIGISKSIQSPTENSTEAKKCREHYETARNAILEGAHWNFARQQRALTLLKDANAGDTLPRPWTYEYAYPPDCAQARYVMPATYTSPGAGAGYPGLVGVSPAVRFLVAVDQDANGNDIKVILTNQPAAELVYTKVITNVAFFDSQFIRALASYLAHMVCMPLKGDRALANDTFKMAERVLLIAQASNGDEGLTVIDGVPEWISARGFAADTAPAGSYLNGPTALTFIT